MPTPFPGMDPFIESSGMWSQFHTRLIVALADELTQKLRPKYRVEIEERAYQQVEFIGARKNDLTGIPDVLVVEQGKRLREAAVAYGETTTENEVKPVAAELPEFYEVKERYLQLRHVESKEIITVIELISPSNKIKGKGKGEYEEKRRKVLASYTHFIEIDLTRSGEVLPMKLHNSSAGDYRILVSRAPQRPRADVYAFTLRQRIPSFPVPLLPEDAEPIVALNQLVHELYDRAGYDMAIDYRQPLEPPLAKEDQEWAIALIKKISQAT
jgi:hypothetical protein